MKASISLLTVICGLTQAINREHFYFNNLKTWGNAQTYCRTNYEDLSTITSQEEENVLLQKAGNVLYKWIGLNRKPSNTKQWLWSDGKPLSYIGWDTFQPDNVHGTQYCVMITDKWHDYFCSEQLTFFCSKTKYILVKEKMTWNEALQYCRTNHSDLASMTSKRQSELAKQVTTDTQIEKVWTGLRYLVGKWLWVDNEPLGDQILLPECPVQPYRCGAFNIKTGTWDNLDCEEKLNFICN